MAIYVRRTVRGRNRWPWMMVGILAVLGASFLLGRELLARIGKAPGRGPLTIELARGVFGQGDFVEVEVRVRVGDRGKESPRPTIRLLDERGQDVVGVGGATGVALGYDAQKGCWRGRWAVPWGAEGRFRVVASLRLGQEPQAQAKGVKGDAAKAERVLEVGKDFLVRKAGPSPAAGGYAPARPGRVNGPLCIVTLESLKDYRTERLMGPEGEGGDWRVLFDWAEWMGANTFWYSGGWTGSWGEQLTQQEPWVKSNLQQTKLFAAEARRRGMRFGAWILAYATHGRRELLPRYQYAWDYDPGTRGCQETTAISLLDGKRLDDVAKLVKELAEDENVNMVGMDYIRTVKGGYEMVDDFVGDMQPLGLPAEWTRMGKRERMAWLGRRIEETKEEGISDAWNWWRARKVKALVEEIRKRSGIKKPLWVFTLSWQHGMQHGQDPLMMMAAGADLDAVMLYESNRAQYNQLMKDWHGYVRVGEVEAVVGDVVDWDLHQRTLNPAGPEEAYLRARTATKYLLAAQEQVAPGGSRTSKPETRNLKLETRNLKLTEPPQTVVLGVFWHDLERLMKGRLGPYPSQEWALAGARVFSEVERDMGAVPVELGLQVPARAEGGKPFTAEVKVADRGAKDLEQVRVEVVKTVGIRTEGDARKELGTLHAGEESGVRFSLRAGGDLGARGNRAMVAVRCTWSAQVGRKQATTFEYVTAR